MPDPAMIKIPAISLVMPTVDWDSVFCRCARAAIAALGPGDEVLIVFDGAPPPAPPWLTDSRVILMSTAQRSGPAAARNLAANRARNEILLFVDADVELHADAVDRVRHHFTGNSTLDAVFGSYDADPAAPELVSQFRNLLHHYTHTNQPGVASTFWAGCGAVRRECFLALGGFDANAYQKPCIEDIEFGLRLHDEGGQILLDPAIQGKHHKRWTLMRMIRTDIQQRAIPWTRLLLSRRHLPATLNLSQASQLSALVNLVLLGALASLPVRLLWPWGPLALAAAVAMHLLLNQPFLAFLQRCGGVKLLIAGTCLHSLYLFYSTLTFAAVALVDLATARLQAPDWLKRRSSLVAIATNAALAALAIIAVISIAKGLFYGFQARPGTDIYQRFDEWRLFQAGIYPSGALATPLEKALPYFRTTVYLPWALPLFGSLFAWGGIWQGKIIVLSGSIAALALLSRLGWCCLRPWGRSAAWLGLLAPLCILGNSLCLIQGQFSMLCMGFISLQWLLLRKRQNLGGALCWSLAMIKPQIALPFVLPLLLRRRLPALLMAIGLLVLLSVAALVHTETMPAALMMSWLKTLNYFVGSANSNALAAVIRTTQEQSSLILIPLLVGGAAIAIWLGSRLLPNWSGLDDDANIDDTLNVAGLCSIIGFVGLYHDTYDKIMLYPALLACLRGSMRHPSCLSLLLSLLMASSLWLPEGILNAWLGRQGQALAWSLVAVALLLRLTRRAARSNAMLG